MNYFIPSSWIEKQVLLVELGRKANCAEDAYSYLHCGIVLHGLSRAEGYDTRQQQQSHADKVYENRQQRQRDDKKAHLRRQQQQRDDERAYEKHQQREEDDKKMYENRQQQQREDRKAYEKRQLLDGTKKDMKECQGRMKSGPGATDHGRTAPTQQPSVHADKHPDYDCMDAENEKDRDKESY